MSERGRVWGTGPDFGVDNIKKELGKFIMVSQPIDLGRLVVSSGSVIFFDTPFDVRLKLHHPKGGWGGVDK